MISKITATVREKRVEIVRFSKFVVVGTIGTAIDFGLFNLFHNVLGLHAVLSNTLSIKLSFIDNYENRPIGEGIKKNDAAFLAGLSIKF